MLLVTCPLVDMKFILVIIILDVLLVLSLSSPHSHWPSLPTTNKSLNNTGSPWYPLAPLGGACSIAEYYYTTTTTAAATTATADGDDYHKVLCSTVIPSYIILQGNCMGQKTLDTFYFSVFLHVCGDGCIGL